MMRTMAGIVGRQEELSTIDSFLDHAGDGLRALVVEGEAGIGKSTIWLAAVEAARSRDFGVRTSRPAETEQTLANVALTDLFGDTPEDALASLPPPRRRAFDAAILLRDEPGLPIDPLALGVAIVSLVQQLAGGRPLVLAVDDEQWLDPSSASTLTFAIRRIPNYPVLLLVSRRTGIDAGIRLEDAVDQGRVNRLVVGPLGVRDIERTLSDRLGMSFSRSTLLRLHGVSGGNPFYALELARAQDSRPDDGTAPTVVIPPTLERLVDARLATLDPATRQSLVVCAAHGRMPIALLEALGIDAEPLRPAIAGNVIVQTGDVLTFTHPLLASAVYQGADAQQVRAAHRAIAGALSDPVDRGRHLALAADAPDAELAASLEDASRTASARGSVIAAAELAEHAVRLTPPEAADERHRRAVATASALLAAGRGDRARSIAIGLGVASPHGRRRAEALMIRADLEELRSSKESTDTLDEALGEAAADPDLEAVIHARMAETGRFVHGREWAQGHAEASLAIAEQLGDDHLRAAALTMVARLRLEGGDPTALGLAERAHEVASHAGEPALVMRTGWGVGEILALAGAYDRARLWLAAELDKWRDRDERVRFELHWYLALVEFFSGRWAAALRLSEEAKEISDEYGIETPHDWYIPALVAAHRGQFRKAIEHAEQGIRLAGEQALPYLFAIPGLCAAWTGRFTEAIDSFHHAEDAADTRGWEEPNLRWWRDDLAEALVRVERDDEAADLIARWETSASRLGRPRVVAQALRCRAHFAAAQGDTGRAISLLEEVASAHAEAADPFGRSRALLALGIARLRTRQKRAARSALDAALVGFEALGAVSWAASARAELGRIGGRQRIEGLSPSEGRVAALVAEGLTNREIAAALFLGERTVASHLTRVYSKTGTRSRTELARLLPNDGSASLRGSKLQTS